MEMNLIQYCKIVASAQEEFKDTVAKASAVLHEKLDGALKSFIGDKDNIDRSYYDDELGEQPSRMGHL